MAHSLVSAREEPPAWGAAPDGPSPSTVAVQTKCITIKTNLDNFENGKRCCISGKFTSYLGYVFGNNLTGKKCPKQIMRFKIWKIMKEKYLKNCKRHYILGDMTIFCKFGSVIKFLSLLEIMLPVQTASNVWFVKFPAVWTMLPPPLIEGKLPKYKSKQSIRECFFKNVLNKRVLVIS